MSARQPLPNSVLYAKHVEMHGTPPSFSPVDPPKRKKRSNEEWRMQADLFAWWRDGKKRFGAYRKFGVAECLLFHIPNGGALGQGKEDWEVTGRKIRGRMLKLAGLTVGIPDLMLAVPMERHTQTPLAEVGALHNSWRVSSEWHGLFVELKTPAGIISPEQETVMGYLTARGYKTIICRSTQDAIDAITVYLSQ